MSRRLIQLGIGLAISAVLVFVLVKQIDTTAVVQAIALADARLIVGAVAVYLFAMCLRAMLWGRLLSNAVPTALLFRVLIVGFAISFLLPLRLGEIARAYLLKRWANVGYVTTLASIVAERVLDGLAVGSIMLVAALFIDAPAYVFGLGFSVVAGFAFMTIVLVVASTRGASLIDLSTAVAARVPPKFGKIAVGLARGFASGLEPLKNVRALPELMALSIAGWLCQFLVFYLIMLAFPMRASFPLALLGGGVANFATLLPSAPGFVGTFDAALMKVVMDVQGVSLEIAAAYALVVHTVIVVPIVVLGGLILWRANLSFAHVMGRSFRTQAPAPAAAKTAAAAPAINTTVLPF
jgi:uncharacterized protein (TIRG00374 family)